MNYIKQLEEENKTVKLRLLEEINKRKEEESFTHNESKISIKKEIPKKEIESEKQSELISQIKEKISDEDFFKTISASKIIVFKRIYEISDNLDKLLSKLKTSMQEDLKGFKISAKKIIGESLSLLGIVQKEIIYLHLYYEGYYTSHLKLQKITNKIFSEFEVYIIKYIII